MSSQETDDDEIHDQPAKEDSHDHTPRVNLPGEDGSLKGVPACTANYTPHIDIEYLEAIVA